MKIRKTIQFFCLLSTAVMAGCSLDSPIKYGAECEATSIHLESGKKCMPGECPNYDVYLQNKACPADAPYCKVENDGRQYCSFLRQTCEASFVMLANGERYEYGQNDKYDTYLSNQICPIEAPYCSGTGNAKFCSAAKACDAVHIVLSDGHRYQPGESIDYDFYFNNQICPADAPYCLSIGTKKYCSYDKSDVPPEVGETCVGAEAVYISSSEWCEGSSCEYSSKYIDKSVCPPKYPYCIRSKAAIDHPDIYKHKVFCAVECVLDTSFLQEPVVFNEELFKDDPSIDKRIVIDGQAHACLTNSLTSCNNRDCTKLGGWKSGSCEYNQGADGGKGSGTCVATACEPFYKLYFDKCVPYANCCGLACGQCAGHEGDVCSGLADGDGCGSRYSVSCNGVFCGGVILEDGGEPVGGVCIRPDVDAKYCGISSDCKNFTDCTALEGKFKCSGGECVECEENDTDIACGGAGLCGVDEHVYFDRCEKNSREHCGSHDYSCIMTGVSMAECVTDGDGNPTCDIIKCHDGFALIKDDDGAEVCRAANECCGAACINCSELSETPYCLNGECAASCNPTEDPESVLIGCDYVCVNPLESPTYCGVNAFDIVNGVCPKNICPSDQICEAGECRCSEGFHLFGDGCEEDTVENCGEHGNSCLSDEGVAAAECVDDQLGYKVCRTIACLENVGYHLIENVEGKTLCEKDSPEACGESGLNCIDEIENAKIVDCVLGKCVVSKCEDGYYINNNKCVEIQGVQCGDIYCIGNQVCIEDTHTCACEPESEECDGVCYNLKSDTQHCGDCNTDCQVANADYSCADGQCVFSCHAGFHEHDNGCEADDMENCGAHGAPCDSTVIPNGASFSCDEGKCVVNQCDLNYHLYDNTCEEDTAEHCGSHENSCPSVDGGTYHCQSLTKTCELQCNKAHHLYEGGCEINDLDNCGRHGNSCSIDYSCCTDPDGIAACEKPGGSTIKLCTPTRERE